MGCHQKSKPGPGPIAPPLQRRSGPSPTASVPSRHSNNVNGIHFSRLIKAPGEGTGPAEPVIRENPVGRVPSHGVFRINQSAAIPFRDPVVLPRPCRPPRKTRQNPRNITFITMKHHQPQYRRRPACGVWHRPGARNHRAQSTNLMLASKRALPNAFLNTLTLLRNTLCKGHPNVVAQTGSLLYRRLSTCGASQGLARPDLPSRPTASRRNSRQTVCATNSPGGRHARQFLPVSAPSGIPAEN